MAIFAMPPSISAYTLPTYPPMGPPPSNTATRSPLWQPRPPPAPSTPIRRSTPPPSSRASQQLSPNLKITDITPHLPPPPNMSTFATRFTDRVFADVNRVEHIHYDDSHQWLDVFNDAAGFLPTLKKPPGRLSAPLMCAGIAITEALDLTPITGDFKLHLHVTTVWALQLELVIKFSKATHLLINANPKVAQLADLGHKQELFYQSQTPAPHPPSPSLHLRGLYPGLSSSHLHLQTIITELIRTCILTRTLFTSCIHPGHLEANTQGSGPPSPASGPRPKSRPPVAPPSTPSHKAEKPTPPPNNATARRLEKIRDSFGKHRLTRRRAPPAPTPSTPPVTTTATSTMDDTASAVSDSTVTPSASASNSEAVPPPTSPRTSVPTVASTPPPASAKAPEKALPTSPRPSGHSHISCVSNTDLEKTLLSLKREILNARRSPKKPPASSPSPPAPQKATPPLRASSIYSGALPSDFSSGFVPVLLPLRLLGAFLSSLPAPSQ
ncbi:hypothetical protein BOTBODRAFT_177403 [Botryobasidium botryosum FD-172 SS1]|uniref:Uncharacterized protein n=1 Tax=Botryobasidium botryosum (strain FD-172 SS1) TaxID=930990 RepID=A0A067M9L1_BOTB1|nr:hypothetical protein BOTBODRAFT_177403 [Botryobasidium botryosum FD-172 SS1]